QNVGRWLVGLFVVALVAWLTGMPLIAYHFHRITPWAILGSVVLFPLVSLTMLFGFAKLLLAGVFPVIGWLLSWPLRIFSDITISTAECLSKLPYSNINTAPPPLWFIAIFYLLLVWAGLSVRRGKGVTRVTLVGLLIWMIAFVWWTPFQQKPQPRGPTRLDVLAVGHGCAAVLELPDGKVICYDAGSMSNFSMGDNIIVPFLRTRGIQSLDALFISHDNIDHFSGVLEVCRDFDVKAVYVSEYLYRNRGAACEFLLKALSDSDIPLRQVNRQSCPFSSDAPEHEAYKIDVLWPPKPQINNDLDSNDSSLVLRVSDSQGAILLCGDIGPRPQQQLMQLESTGQLRADVLLLPHHGSTTTILPTFVEAVDPEICLSSDGQLQQRSFEKLQLMLPGRKIIHTFELGAVRVGLTKDGIKIDSYHKDNHTENDK
ncbi:ComEC/Rec2 family competence protein, partial [Planctomycetota bacterium]